MSKIPLSPSSAPAPPLTEFLNTLPSPLTVVLVGLAPSISRVLRFAQILSWKSSWEESWLALAVLWFVCLLSQAVLRYLFPVAVVLLLVLRQRRQKLYHESPLVSEETLQNAVADLITIRTLLPSVPPPSPQPLVVLLRVIGILYVPYLLLTYFVRLRVLFALCGTVLFTWRARWATLIRRSLWRSAYVRWSAYYVWSVLSGQPLPAKTISPDSQLNAQSLSSQAVQSENILRFLFTVYENQRWWMGLDWTAALLPGERPSWCSVSQQPLSPPSSFALPAPTTVYMSDGRGGRVKRKARWGWEEAEWRVMVRSEGGALARVERPLPKEKEEGTATSAILRAAGKMREGSTNGSSPERLREKEGVPRDGQDEVAGEEPLTDEDGWMYADNKWESGSGKGGMGKYTRYRRWTRIAILYETVEPAEPGELGIRIEESPHTARPDVASPKTPTVVKPEPEHEVKLESKDERHGPEEEDKSRLRRRLQAAVMHASHS
ncbi:integral peroxisomal membrane peroxin-domain-containing protein [Sparassis latifolia]